MLASRAGAAAIAALSAACTTGVLAAQSSARPGRAPLTSGTAAMLVARDDAEYRADLRGAIGDSDPAVRAIAARVAGVRHQGDMIEPLRTALASETDPVATREQRHAISRLENAATSDPPDAVPHTTLVRTFPAIARGLLPSLMQATGCPSARDGSFGAARITFDASGAVIRSEVDPSALPLKCRDVLSVMARLAVADDGSASSSVHAEYLLLPLHDGFVKCTTEAGPLSNENARQPGSKVVPPRKIHDVKPEYPRGALAAGAQGVVLVLAHLTQSGCVDNARVTQGLDPELDVAALRAVLQWRFEPARFNDRPTQSLLTVTVSFQVR